MQRRVHRHHAIGHAPGQQGQVALADASAMVFTQQGLQFTQRRALLGHDQQAGGVAIQPMDQLQGLPRAQRTQGLDRPEADAAAAMTGHARGLVQGQQAGILEHDGLLQAAHERLRRTGLVSLLAETHGWYTHLIARLQLALGLGATAVDPHLATAHQLVDQAARGPLQLAEQEVVQALAGAVGGNGDHAHGRLVACGLGGVLGGHQAVYSVTLGGRDKGLISLEVTQGQKPSFRRIRHSARPPPAGRPC